MANKKLDRRSSQSASVPLNHPLPDWETFETAKFYCFSGHYFHSPQNWREALKKEILEITKFDYWWNKWPEVVNENPPRWLVKDMTHSMICLSACDVYSEIGPGWACVSSKDWNWNVVTMLGADEVDQEERWERVPKAERGRAFWHRLILERLHSRWLSNFPSTLCNGGAVVMARKISVLAPFERVEWDQWRYFTIEDQHETRGPDDPRGDVVPLSAVGPSGERLYSIYVAPGRDPVESKEDSRPEKKCQQWLLRLMREFPDRQPAPFEKLYEIAAEKFRGLTERGFERAKIRAQAESGNFNWSRPGRLEKSPQAISAQ